MIVTTTFQNKTYVVQATQVKPNNLDELAEWCGGDFIKSYQPSSEFRSDRHRAGQPCIEISERGGRKNRAFVGDWITHIHSSDRFKIYRDATFKEAFEEVLRDIPEEVMRKIVREEMRALLDSIGVTARSMRKLTLLNDLERSGYAAIGNVMAMEEAMLPHAWDCQTRNPAVYDENGHKLKCSCGVGDDK